MATSDERYVDYLDFPASNWKRPEGPPRVWRVVQGRRKTLDGRIPRFSIQEVPEELENDVVDFMVRYFIPEDPLGADLGLAEDQVAVREFRTLWKDIVKEGISVVALTVSTDPLEKPAIVGVNILGIFSNEDEDDSEGEMPFRLVIMKKIMTVYFNLMEEADINQKYGVDKYLGAAGLCVHPAFRGQGLGEEILRARNDIGLAYQILVSSTIFTATASQILAARVGYEVLVERKYTEIFDDEGKVAFPGVTVEFMKLMAKKLY